MASPWRLEAEFWWVWGVQPPQHSGVWGAEPLRKKLKAYPETATTISKAGFSAEAFAPQRL